MIEQHTHAPIRLVAARVLEGTKEWPPLLTLIAAKPFKNEFKLFQVMSHLGESNEASFNTSKGKLIPLILVAVYSGLALGVNLFDFIPRIVYYFLCLFAYLYVIVGSKFFQSFGHLSKLCSLIIVFDVLIFVYFILGVSSATIGNVCNQASFFSFILLAIYISKSYSYSQKKWLLLFLLILFIPLVITSVAQHSVYGESINYLLDDELIEIGYVNTTSFNSAVFFLLGWIYFAVLNSDKKFLKIIGIIIAILLLYYLVFCGSRGSIFIILLLLLFCLPYLRKIDYSQKKLVSSIIPFLVVIFLLISLNEILEYFIAFLPERLSYRFQDILSTKNEGISDSSFSGRYGLIKLSVNSWLENPKTFLFGIGDHRGSFTGSMSYIEAGIGGHSEFFDSLARWGIIGGILLIFILKHLKNLFSSCFLSGHYDKQLAFIYWGFIYCLVFKSVFHPNIGCAFFLIGILIYDVLIKKNKI